MPPKDYDLLRPVYGSSIYGEISKVEPAHPYRPVDITISALNIVISHLDQYTENEILETIPKIEKAITDLPINESVKTTLCDILWQPKMSLKDALNVITTLLSYPSYIN